MKTIDTAPRDGTPVIVSHPKLGAHLMAWNNKNNRWEGKHFAPMGVINTWWDENAEQPTHWEMPAV